MTFATTNIEFWTTAADWDATGQADGTFTSGEQSQIIGWVDSLYAGSTEAQRVLNATIAGSQPIRIGANILGDGEPGHHGHEGTKSFITLDLSAISSLYYFNDKGEIVQEKPELTLIHELIHGADSADDPHGAGGPLSAPSDAEMNQASFDFKGDVVRTQNTVAAELGYSDNIQASYGAAFTTASPALPAAPTGGYTGGNHVDVVRLGTSLANDIDHTARTAELDDLIFSGDGADTVKSGLGRDYVYAGDGDDRLEAGGDDGRLEGDAGNDRLISTGGNNTLVGGTGNDILDNTGMSFDLSGGTAVFAAGDGHDKIVAAYITDSPPSFWYTGLNALLITGAPESDLKLSWDYQVVEDIHGPSDDFWYKIIEGDAAIKVGDSGGTIYVGYTSGEYLDSDKDGAWDSFWVNLTTPVYSNDMSTPWNVADDDVIQESVSQYDLST